MTGDDRLRSFAALSGWLGVLALSPAWVSAVSLVVAAVWAGRRLLRLRRVLRARAQEHAGSGGMFLAVATALVLAAAAGAAGDRAGRLAGETGWHASWANPVNRAIYRIGVCETGGKPGQNGRPDWDHEAAGPRGHRYQGAFGFLDTTWDTRRVRVRPLPPKDAHLATPAQQYAVARALVREFGNYSSWPTCHRRLGLP